MTVAPWNAVRFDASRPRGHVESYFFKLNDAAGRRALWVKATVFASRADPGAAVAEAWAIAFDRDGNHAAAKTTIPLTAARFPAGDLDIEVAGLRIGPGSIRGEVADARGRIGVDLAFEGDAAPLVPFPSARLYEGKLPRTKLVSPRPDLRFRGSYRIEGAVGVGAGDVAVVQVDGWRGMQGHNWGSEHTHAYAWCHCNQWDGDDGGIVLEGATARVALGPVVAPPVTFVCVRWRGVRYEWNRPADLVRTRGAIGDLRWTFAAASDVGRIEGEVRGDVRDFVGLYYANPDGRMTYCLNSKIARADVVFEPRGRAPFRFGTRAAALEIATRRAGHGVRMYA